MSRLGEREWAMVMGSKGWAVTMARRCWWGDGEEDRIQAACLGLCRASLSWRVDGGSKFNSWASYWIRNELGRLTAEGLVRFPVGKCRGRRVLVGLSERRVLVRWVVRDVEHDGLPERGGLVDDRDGAELIAERKDLLRVLWELGKCLQIRPWRVLCLRYGLLGGPPLTLEETAKECCVTRERVRQIEMRAVERLRKECEKRGLRFEDLVIE